ncbi:MAG: penicillin-binding protein [Flavobacteriales bacterium]|jgi:cell division protein FtsI (penicillin-binding protein 3)
MNKSAGKGRQWMAVFTAIILLMAIGVLAKLYHVSVVMGPDLIAKARERIIQERTIEASRGNIYSSDGLLLATSMPAYTIHWDSKVVSADRLSQGVSATAAILAQVEPKRNAREWRAFLRSQHAAKKRYILIAKNLTYSEYRTIATSALFKGNRFVTGLVKSVKPNRLIPLKGLAARTIGYSRSDATVGLEASFNEVLRGHDGKRWMQQLEGGHWKPMESQFTSDPVNGSDLITTIDTRMQDVAHRALLKSLRRHRANHGCAVLMEVKTGKIKAIVNLGKTEQDSNYRELINYAVWERTEPGSTFKVAALMVALEDGVIDTATMVNTTGGLHTIYNKKIKDSNWKHNGSGGYGNISVARALELSSNTGIVKALYPHYKSQPKAFIDRLYRMGLDKRTDIEIKGEQKPKIPTTEDDNWYGTTLPWMMFGYGMECTPLQTLTFYNAIANDGIMVRPTLWEAVRYRGQITDRSDIEVLHPSIASKSTLKQIQTILHHAVTRGTGEQLSNEEVSISGKTGTSQLEYWNKETLGYQASFAGYFPSEDPQYACVVVVNRPVKSTGYYGAIVAGPVFKEIALAVNRMQARQVSPEGGYWATGIETKAKQRQQQETQVIQQAEIALESGQMPNLNQWTAKAAMTLLESHGIDVNLNGIGLVKQQYPSAGQRVQSPIKLTLG